VESFDVFLCHNSEDKPVVREISRKLVEKNIKPWLDEDEIRPGTSWQIALGWQIESIKSAAVFVGASGVGPWQNQEIQALLSQFVKRECPVIPVVLPSAKTTPDLPWTLANLRWVDFRDASRDPLKQLIWGITGVKPLEQSRASASDKPEEDVKELLPRKAKQLIEIVLPGNLNEFSEQARDRILAGLSAFLELGEVKLTRAMAGSVRLHLELTPEDADKIYVAAQSGQLADLGISAARLYPAIASPPDEEQRSQLLVLLDRVRETWVDGVLKNSLYNEALISLGKRPIDEAVEPAWRHVVDLSSQRSQLLLQDRKITTIFDATGLLLILGEPGSGKTTTLLELAANLISRAKVDFRERVPVVLNLSSWRKKQPLEKWIASELSEKYRVPVKLARCWLQNDYFVPLLDGLDEVPTSLQPDCVTAINEFIDSFKPAGIAVCCRLMEYHWLPARLKLNGAICLESLSSEEVGKYLATGGSKLAALRDAVSKDPVLKELTQTPLMLSVMSLAYQETGVDELAKQKGDSPQERRKRIFGLYVEQMFQRKGMTSLVFPEEKMIGYLSWLARKMREHSQSVFLVEGLQPSWLGSRAQRGIYGTVVALTLGLIVGLIVGMIVELIGVPSVGPMVGPMIGPLSEVIVNLVGVSSIGPIVGVIAGLIIFVGVGLGCWSRLPLKNLIASGSIGLLIPAMSGVLIGAPIRGLIFGLINGLSVGLLSGLGVGSLNRITLVETMRWRWNLFWKRSIPGSIVGLIFGLIFDLIFGLRVGLSVGLIFGLLGGLVSGLVGGFTDSVKVGKALPNQGIQLSGKNSLILFLITWLTVWFIVWLVFALILWRSEGLSEGLTGGLVGGLIVGLNRGGSAVIKHYAVRLTLWLNGYTPFNLVKFLDHCARLILLKKVGGGYIFIHRMLLEYFAELNPQPTKARISQEAKGVREGFG
jgi:eukaryotic-like serine/threonine-protein kinase